MQYDRVVGLVVVVLIIGCVIYFLEGKKASIGGEAHVVPIAVNDSDGSQLAAEKKKQFTPAKEIVDPSGFINVEELRLAELIGKQVILVDFWTYSCINCQRTQPYLNAWHDKYADSGLTIVGVHTPEFEFEKNISNVERAVAKAGIKYPVVLDNNYATWRAYANRYWPRKYLIDIDGYIVYDHIGEGAYEETEQVIARLLKERADHLGENVTIEQSSVQVTAMAPSVGVSSPEVYFGSTRNELLGNGRSAVTGEQVLTTPSVINLNELLLDGTWNIQPEYAMNTSRRATITFKYKAKDVFMVAAAELPATVTVRRDGELVVVAAGGDVDQASQVVIDQEQLYHLVAEGEVGEHTLELIIQEPGLQAFTFTFG